MTAKDRTPLVICIDVEPDERRTNPREPKPWTGFEVLAEYLQRMRPELSRALGVPVCYTWLLRLDPQIEITYGSAEWPIRRYRPLFESLAAAGDELGIHAHAWRWQEDEGWLVDHGDARWVDHCLQTCVRNFRGAFGRPPRVSKFGDGFFSNGMARCLEREGIVCDLTLEPGRAPKRSGAANEWHTGALPNFSAVPRHPYRPSRWDFRRPGRFWKRNLWLMPLTTGRVLGPLPGLTDELLDCVTMLLGFPFPAVQRLFDTILTTENRPVLAAVCRTDVLLDRFNGEQFKQFFDYLLSHPLRQRLAVETPLEALRRVA